MPFKTIPRPIGGVMRLMINQAKRDIVIMENCKGYDLGIYVMPAGRATLIRVAQISADPFRAAGRCGLSNGHYYHPEQRMYSAASKKERDRYARVILKMQLDTADWLIDEASYARTRSAQFSRRRAAESLRKKTKEAIDALPPATIAKEVIFANPPVTIAKEA